MTGKKHVIILIMSLKYIRRFVNFNKVLLYITILRLLRLVFLSRFWLIVNQTTMIIFDDIFIFTKYKYICIYKADIFWSKCQKLHIKSIRLTAFGEKLLTKKLITDIISNWISSHVVSILYFLTTLHLL